MGADVLSREPVALTDCEQSGGGVDDRRHSDFRRRKVESGYSGSSLRHYEVGDL